MNALLSVLIKKAHPCLSLFHCVDQDVAQTVDINVLNKAGFFLADKRPAEPPTQDFQVVSRDNASFFTQLEMLTIREKTSLIKNPTPMIINVCLTSFMAVVFGIIFYQIGAEDRSDPIVVQSQLGALMNVMMSTMMGQAQTALIIFTSERPLFLREYSTDHYGIVPYFLSHLAAEALQCFVAMVFQSLIAYFMIAFQMTFIEFFLISFTLAMTTTAVAVMLAAWPSDVKTAQALFPLVVVPQFYFSGVFIAINLIPSGIRWAQYLCSMMYAARISFSYEFDDCSPGLPAQNCEDILERNGVDPDDKWWYWLALVALFVTYRFVALLVLRKKGIDFS
jgi:ABC-type multidrug transport system permease subunit